MKEKQSFVFKINLFSNKLLYEFEQSSGSAQQVGSSHMPNRTHDCS